MRLGGLGWQRCCKPPANWRELRCSPFCEHGRTGMEYAYSTPNGIRHYRRYGEGRRAYWTKLVREILQDQHGKDGENEPVPTR